MQPAGSPLRGPGFQAALNGCLGLSRPSYDLDVASVRRPGVLDRLWVAWSKDLALAVSPFGTERDDAACMSGQRVPGLHGRSYGYHRAEALMARVHPRPRQLPVAGEPLTAAWQRFLAVERQLADADWACRSSHYDDAVLAVGPALFRFESGHARDLARAASYWRTVGEHATRLGYDGETRAVDLERTPAAAAR